MCIEFAWKRGGISLIRNFLHQAEGVSAGIPKEAASKLKIHYKMRKFANGKEASRRYVEDIIDGFPCKGDKK